MGTINVEVLVVVNDTPASVALGMPAGEYAYFPRTPDGRLEVIAVGDGWVKLTQLLYSGATFNLQLLD